MSESEQLVTEEDKKVIDSQDEKTMAVWWCMMNSWKWPEELSDEPENRYLPASEWVANGRRSQVMEYIQDKIGHKATSREWNIDRMTDEGHEEWFNKTFSGN